MKHEILHVFGKWFKEISTKKKEEKKKSKIKNRIRPRLVDHSFSLTNLN